MLNFLNLDSKMFSTHKVDSQKTSITIKIRNMVSSI